MGDWMIAYIDPGAGSLIIQGAIAAVIAVPFFLRQQLGRFVQSVSRRGDQTSPQGPVPDDRT